ncbi:MAG TPA: hypothetical protein VK753_11490 [Xanthomonadaceae bacterium]|jgi:hypothetical protein|nr:hypothetical protein [Xanthomonadaceae bacterium]
MNMHVRTTRAWMLAPVFALLLAGCGPSASEIAAQNAAAEKLEKEAAANAQARNYVQARDAGQYELAQAYANQLLHDAPDSVAATEVRATLADTGVKADEARDKRRLTQLWTYNTEMLEGGGDNNVVYTAAIYASKDPNFNGDDTPVRLVLRRHPKWGRSVYLVLDHGEFDCPPGCKVSVQFDDEPEKMMASSKSDQNKQAMFIDDEETIRTALDKIRVITVKTSVDGRPRALSFEVGGFDRAQLERKLQ